MFITFIPHRYSIIKYYTLICQSPCFKILTSPKETSSMLKTSVFISIAQFAIKSFKIQVVLHVGKKILI